MNTGMLAIVAGVGLAFAATSSRSSGSTSVNTTTAGRPFMRFTASRRSSTVSTRGWRISRKSCSGNCASSACTSRAAVSPVESETTCSSTLALTAGP